VIKHWRSVVFSCSSAAGDSVMWMCVRLTGGCSGEGRGQPEEDQEEFGVLFWFHYTLKQASCQGYFHPSLLMTLEYVMHVSGREVVWTGRMRRMTVEYVPIDRVYFRRRDR